LAFIIISKAMPVPEIRTDRLTLRPPIPADAAAIFERYAQDSLVTRYLIWSPHESVSETEEFIRACIEGSQDGVRFPWVITNASDEAVMGMIELRVEGDAADVGYVLARSEWGRGFATEALSSVLRFAFSMPDVKRVWAVCDVDNAASARVMEKAGMSREGLVPGFIMHPNLSAEPRDVYQYAATRP
jgi:ribosomal-protein-alanine N-acetyltransferase